MANKQTNLIGPRISLRPFLMSDLDDYYALVANFQVAKTAGFTPANDLMEAKFLLGHQVQLANVFAVVTNGPNEQLIGSIGLYERMTKQGEPDETSRDLGYMLNQTFWHQGYMTEAVQLILAYGFDHLKLAEIAASCLAENVASQKILDHFQFRYLMQIQHSEYAQFGAGQIEEFYHLTRETFHQELAKD